MKEKDTEREREREKERVKEKKKGKEKKEWERNTYIPFFFVKSLKALAINSY